MPPVEERIARIASRQKGLVTWRQLLHAGVSTRSIKRRLRDGRLHRVFRGVYLVGHEVMAPLARELAAVLAYEPSALSHRSSIGLWQMLPRLPYLVDITIAGRNAGRQKGIVLHRARSLDPRDITRKHGIPVTTPARTLLDFAETTDDHREVERAWSEAQARNLISSRKIEELLGRSRGRRGMPVIAELLTRAAGPRLSKSELEELMLHLVREARLPEPEMNVLLLGRYKVDFLWRDHRTIAETDGAGWHASNARRTNDHRRDSDLRDAGYKVERFTDHELTSESHAAMVRLARAIYSATP